MLWPQSFFRSKGFRASFSSYLKSMCFRLNQRAALRFFGLARKCRYGSLSRQTFHVGIAGDGSNGYEV
ncbi:hypothetical protein OH492_10850 [Vibrio chagasii]|nr:hypothetical protein [Vibrio chagasii]